ncbi:mitochondria-eating protein-like, partial [Anneissia japonica]|uniref:mitochondria-eating protein-like n=1 Tax=Anneissia japonica TaxID=1529436 RepID=UPI0014256FFC
MDYISTLPPAVSGKMSGNSDVVQRVRQANLVTRFSHMFTEERMDAMDMLRNHCEDHEMNQRVIMACVKESFRCSKLAFQQYRSKIRSTLQLTHDGLETLEEAVQNYINRNGQLLDVHSIIQDVLSALNHHPTIAYPPVVDFNILITFIRELVKTAWNMAALPSPLDISVCREAELFDDL